MTSKRIEDLNKFAETQDDVSGILKRKSEEVTSEYNEKRKRLIDDTDRTVKIADLQRVCPWVPQFTPSAKDSDMKEPPKRPSSPITGRPLKSSDLTPIDMIREDGSNASNNNSNSSGAVRFVCSVSRYKCVVCGMCVMYVTYCTVLHSVYVWLFNLFLMNIIRDFIFLIANKNNYYIYLYEIHKLYN